MTYLGLVGKQFAIDPNILSAIVLNEVEHRGGFPYREAEPIQKRVAEFLRRWDINVPGVTGHDLNDPSLGIAQMKVSTAELLEDNGLVPPDGGDIWGIVSRLSTPEGALYYAAAYLSYLKTGVLTYYGEQDNRDALIASYNLGPRQFAAAEDRTGCGYCGPAAQKYVNNTESWMKRVGSARLILAVQLSE